MESFSKLKKTVSYGMREETQDPERMEQFYTQYEQGLH